MNLDQQLKEIRDACIKANPEIVELNFGCLVEGNYASWHLSQHLGSSGWHFVSVENPNASWTTRNRTDFNVIGRPIRLADVLLAIGEDGIDFGMCEIVDEKFAMQAHRSVGEPVEQGYWNLRQDDLTQQSPETIAFVHSLIAV